MAKITSRTQINIGTELTLDTTLRTIKLNATGNLVAKDGVTLQALYSKLVDLWTSAIYNDFPFPAYSIDALSGQFQLGTDGQTFNGWKPLDDTTRQMLRDGGWSEFSSTGVLNRQYAGIVSLGSVSSGSQLYYQATTSDAPTNFTFSDAVNQGVQVFGDATNGNFDKRTYFKGFVREYGKLYKDSVLLDTGKVATGAYIVNMLLSNDIDLKIQANDAAMLGAPYSGITVTYNSTPQNRTIGGTAYPFNVIISGNGATLEQIYTKIQYLLRQTTDIDSGPGTVTGKTAAALLGFVGNNMITTTGVYIDNIQAADSNRIAFLDNTGTSRTNPYTAAGIISFNAPLLGAGSNYRLMFTSPPGVNTAYGQVNAITVLDAAGLPITGTISSGSVVFTFAYDSDTLGGAASTDKAVTLIGVRPGSGKFAVATGVLSKSSGISLSLVAEQDRVYA